MRPRRTAIVPNMIWGTAIASMVPSQLVACGGSATEPGSGGSGGQVSSAGHAGRVVSDGGRLEGYAGYIALAVAAFGGRDFGNGTGGTDVLMAGAGGSAAGSGGAAGAAGSAGNVAGVGGTAAGAGGSAAGAGGKTSGTGHGGGFIVLAAAAFGGKSQ